MESRMEMIYVGRPEDDACYKTGVGAIFDTNAETYAAFKSAKPIGVPIKEATFLLNYYNRNGDLSDTIGLTAEGYTYITGEKVLSEHQYQEIDDRYWNSMRHNPGGKPASEARSA